MKVEIERASLLQIKRNAQNVIKHIEDVLAGIDDGSSFERMTHQEKADFILDGTCAFFNVTKQDLLKRTNNSTTISRKKYLIYLLHVYVHWVYQDISDYLGYVSHATAYKHIEDMKLRLSEGHFGDGVIRNTYASLIEYIGLNK